MSACDHMVTQSRAGESGSWCSACGVKVYAVHDRPCKECAHYKDLSRPGDPYRACMKLLMRVTPEMRVTYKITATAGGEPGLCFEEIATP